MSMRRKWYTVVAEWRDGESVISLVRASDANEACAVAQEEVDQDGSLGWWMVAVFPGRHRAEVAA